MPPLSFQSPVLALEASTVAGSVAVWRDGVLVGASAVVMGAGQDDRLFPAIQQLLAEAQLPPRALHAVVCGSGPGSFTSLRIAAALAKGLAHGTGAALYAVPSLLVAAASLEAATDPASMPHFVVHADALRGERYVLPIEREAGGLIVAAGPLARVGNAELEQAVLPAMRVGVIASPFSGEAGPVTPDIRHLPAIGGAWRARPVSLEQWEPEYGRLAEAQVKWEERHGTALPDTPAVRA